MSSSGAGRGALEGLLAALEVSEDRRRRRVRNTMPDQLGLDLKRRLLETLLGANVPASNLEAWLCAWIDAGPAAQDQGPGEAEGSRRAVALEVLEDLRLAGQIPGLGRWLEEAAESAGASVPASGEPGRTPAV